MVFDMSRLFIYYNERLLDGTVNEDSGANLRDGAAVINASGSCWCGQKWDGRRMCFPEIGNGGRNEPDDTLPKTKDKPEMAK